jgi:hypothetical protein
MKLKFATSLLIMFPLILNAEELQNYFDWDHPSRPFSAAEKLPQSTIKWITVDNVMESCEKESRRRGFKGFGGIKMMACSFYVGDQCTIITSRNPTMHSVGHEVRHCFQGDWHK